MKQLAILFLLAFSFSAQAQNKFTITVDGGGAAGMTQAQKDSINTALNGKQATLVSGTTIKTVNGSSLLGSGDLTISGGGSGLSLTTSSIITSGQSYRVAPNVAGATDMEVYNIGNANGLSDGRMSIKTGLGKVNYALATTFNLKWNSTLNKWQQDISTYKSAWLEHGVEGITLHAIPENTSEIYSGVIHENFQVRADGVDGVPGITTGQWIQAKTPLFMSYKSASITDDTHPGNFNQFSSNGSAPFIMLHSPEGKGSENEFIRLETTSATSTGPIFYFRKSRGSLQTRTASQANDFAGLIAGSQYDGSIYQNTARIGFQLENTATAGVAPQGILFQTSATNSAGILTRLKIKSNGHIVAPYLPTYADETAAAAAGLEVGTLYQTSNGDLRIKLPLQ